MSLNNLVQISRGAFRVLDASMNATAQNVANMETDGYTRRRVTLQPESLNTRGLWSQSTNRNATGAGVSVADYERLRDTLLQKQTWQARAGLGASTEQHRLLSTVEGILGASGDTSLTTRIGVFFEGWSALADNPNSLELREDLRARAQDVVDVFNRLDGDLNALSGQVRGDLTSSIENANSLVREIAALNHGIHSARNQGAPDLAAEDRRDVLIDELSSMLPVDVQTDRVDGLTISVNGRALVQGSWGGSLELDGDALRISGANGSVALPLESRGGTIGAQMATLTRTIPDTRASLDDIAAKLAEAVNFEHEQGYSRDGNTWIDAPAFFHTDGDITAGNIRLSDEIIADAGLIASTTVNPGDPASEGQMNNDVARSIARLRDPGSDGFSAERAFTALASRIGTGVKSSAVDASAQENVVGHLTSLERGVSGVDLEEEMTNLIRFQQAYAASARVLNAAQEMMDTLLRL